jgi:hypothetical protein
MRDRLISLSNTDIDTMVTDDERRVQPLRLDHSHACYLVFYIKILHDIFSLND